MKNFLIGLLTGIVLSVIACLLLSPKLRQTAYDNGFNDGNKKGVATGTKAGIAKGIDELTAEEKHERDSAAIVEQNNEAAWKAAHQQHKKVAPPVQNWHVIDGKIEAPVVDTTNTHKKKHAKE